MGVSKLLKAGIENEEQQIQNAAAATWHSAASETTSSAGKKRGRRTNEEKGIKNRKQYTITLMEDDYSLFLQKAYEEGVSFAKFMEDAAKEYIRNH
jgi:hypothetical protein